MPVQINAVLSAIDMKNTLQFMKQNSKYNRLHLYVLNEKKNLYLEICWKNTEMVGEFCQSEKVEILINISIVSFAGI